MQVMEAVGVMNQGLDIPKDVDPQWASLIQRCLWRFILHNQLEYLHRLITNPFKFFI